MIAQGKTDWAEVVFWLGCFIWIFICIGDPDILDAIVHKLME